MELGSPYFNKDYIAFFTKHPIYDGLQNLAIIPFSIPHSCHYNVTAHINGFLSFFFICLPSILEVKV